MATRTPHTGAALEVFTAANLAKYPKGWLGYIIRTSDMQTTVTSEVALTGMSVTVTVGANRLLLVAGYVGRIASTVAGDMAQLSIQQDSVNIAASRIDVGQTVSSANGGAFGYVEALLVGLAAGSYTFGLAGNRIAGTGDIGFRAASNVPATLKVTDIGPSS